MTAGVSDHRFGTCGGLVLPLAGALLGLVASPARAQQPPVRIAPGANVRVAPGEFNESWIAVSAANPDFLMAVAQTGGGVDIGATRDAATFASRDGGRIWTRVALPGYRSNVFDPMVAAGTDGRMYVMQELLGGNFASLIGADPAVAPTIRVWSTTDGWTWTGPAELKTPVQPDHARMVADLSNGPHRGRLYVAWNDVADEFLRDHYEVFLQWSDDGGATFTEPLLVDQRTGGKLVATEPVVLSDGTLLVTWYQYWNPLPDARNDRLPFFVRRSGDGGAMFAPVERIFEFGPHVWRDRMGEFSRAFSLPIVVADTSSRSPHRDNIYIVWDDVKSGYSDIWLVRSTDMGRTWSSPHRVNDNAPGAPLGVADYRMTPTVAVAPDGTVGIAWYDRRNDPTRRCWELFFAVSTDGGATTGENVPVTTAQSCPPPGQAPAVIVHNRSPERDLNRPPVRVPIQIRNVSGAPIFGPVMLRIVAIAETSAGASATVTGRNARQVSFAGRLGADDILLPIGLSEPVEITLRIAEATGLDAALDFRVIGQMTGR
jgi:hypothetical protein